MSAKSTAEEKVVSLISAKLAEESFSFDQSLFVKDSDAKEDIFSLQFTKYGKVTQVYCMAAVGIKEIEAIKKAQKGVYGIPPKHSFSVAIDIWRVSPERKYQFDSNRSEELKAAIEGVLSDFQDIALPYYEQFHGVCDVDTALNSAPLQPARDNISPHLRCYTGVIASKLSGRANHNEVVQAYEKKLETSAKGFYLGTFRNLVQKLEDGA